MRHSLSNWFVNQTEEILKTLQCLLRSARIEATLDHFMSVPTEDSVFCQAKIATLFSGEGEQVSFSPKTAQKNINSSDAKGVGELLQSEASGRPRPALSRTHLCQLRKTGVAIENRNAI
jgi:hypothetical protein